MLIAFGFISIFLAGFFIGYHCCECYWKRRNKFEQEK